MENFRKRIGVLGEKITQKYLEDKGYRLIRENYRARFGEIDLIAQENGQLVFIEVKTRTIREYGLPEQAIDFRKKERILKTAQLYLLQNKEIVESYRFDAICVYLDTKAKKAKIKHYKNITG